MATHSSILAWRIPWRRDGGGGTGEGEEGGGRGRTEETGGLYSSQDHTELDTTE